MKVFDEIFDGVFSAVFRFLFRRLIDFPVAQWSWFDWIYATSGRMTMIIIR
jgi:hypothetical protein